MRKQFQDIQEDQIRIIGDKIQTTSDKKKWVVIAITCLIIALIIFFVFIHSTKQNNKDYTSSFEPQPTPPIESVDTIPLFNIKENNSNSYIERKDTCINDVELRLFIPHNAEMQLHIGRIEKGDSSIIFVAQAADLRADNGEIVGAFVYKGKPISWGKSKKGYCASINGSVYVGVAESTPLFEMATENEGYFFRQYALVDNGKLVENNPKGKTIRRAICQLQGNVFMVESLTRESFHDFAQSLVDLGVNNAIYLVGTNAYGWSVDQDGITHEHGEDIWSDNPSTCPKNISYIVWKKK